MKKLVIFDLDGTLLNTISDLANSTNHALTECGYPIHPISEYSNFVGHGINNLFRCALPIDRKTDEEIAKIRSIFLPYYNQHNCDHTIPYNGITEVINHLEELGYSIAVASNKYQEATEKLVSRYFPKNNFIAVFGQRNGIAIKPDPQIVFQIKSKANVELEDIVYVGDSDVDIATARNAGVISIAVSWGFRSKEKLIEDAPTYLVNDSEQLDSLLTSLKNE